MRRWVLVMLLSACTTYDDVVEDLQATIDADLDVESARIQEMDARIDQLEGDALWVLRGKESALGENLYELGLRLAFDTNQSPPLRLSGPVRVPRLIADELQVQADTDPPGELSADVIQSGSASWTVGDEAPLFRLPDGESSSFVVAVRGVDIDQNTFTGGIWFVERSDVGSCTAERVAPSTSTSFTVECRAGDVHVGSVMRRGETNIAWWRLQ